MRIRSNILIFSLTALVACGQDKPGFILMEEGGLYGYINGSGRMVIAPRFYDAGRFSEGLAAARSAGTYGYIDTTGAWKIQPRFDFADSFKDGRALVYANGKPLIIGRDGKVVFENSHAALQRVEGAGCLVVGDSVGNELRFGLTDRQGVLLVPVEYDQVTFNDGRAVLTRSVVDGADLYGVVDTSGRWVVPFGTYPEIHRFYGGMAVVKVATANEDDETNVGAIDRDGQLRFSTSSDKFGQYSNQFREGYAIIDVTEPGLDRGSRSIRQNDGYKAFIDMGGKVTASDTMWTQLTPVDHGRAFAKSRNGQWMLVDPMHGRIGNDVYKNVVRSAFDEESGVFAEGIALVELSGRWVVIDTSGRLVQALDRLDTDADELMRGGDIVRYGVYGSEKDGDERLRWGLCDLRTGGIVDATYDDLFPVSDDPGIFCASRKGRPGYIDRAGHVVWQGTRTDAKGSRPLNIDFMNRGYFYASSTGSNGLDGPGGWGRSSNRSGKFKRSGSHAPNDHSGGGVQIITDTSSHEPWVDAYQGFHVCLRNSGKDTAYFSAQDSRLYMWVQAKDSAGEWKDIEYLPSSWCGNSYHTLFLAPEEEWQFVAPVYEGSIPTQLRICVKWKSGPDRNEEQQMLYSAPFAGSVNPAQFWRKQGYAPRGLMDPYFD